MKKIDDKKIKGIIRIFFNEKFSIFIIFQAYTVKVVFFRKYVQKTLIIVMQKCNTLNKYSKIKQIREKH